MPAFAPLLRADLLLRAALVVGGGLRAPRCTRAAPNGVFVRAFMVAKRRGKLEMGSMEAEVMRTSYWVSAVQGADVHGAGQQQREPRSARRQHEPHAIRQQPPQKALRHHTFGRGIFGSRSFFVSGSRPKWKGAVRGNVTPASDEETLGRSCLPGGHFLSPAGRAGGAAGAGACRRRCPGTKGRNVCIPNKMQHTLSYRTIICRPVSTCIFRTQLYERRKGAFCVRHTSAR